MWRTVIAAMIGYYVVVAAPALVAQAPPRVSDGLRIVVIEGEEAVNIIQQKTAVAPVVEVRDRNNLPVPGAVVTFSIGTSNTASFAGGASTLTVTTNAAGRAVAAAVNPLASGSVQIQVTALAQGQTAAATIVQSNVLNAAQAAAAGGASSGSAGGSTSGAGAAGGGGMSGQTLGIIGGVAAAGAGIAVATSGGSDAATPPAPPSISGVSASPAIGLQSATSFAFTASVSAQGSPAYTWDFGDGSTANSPSAAHTYQNSGTYVVRLTVSNGSQSDTRDTSITVRSVTGRWAGTWRCTEPDAVCQGGLDVAVSMDVVQSGAGISGSSTIRYGAGPVYTCPLSGRVEAPLRVIFADNTPCPAISPTWVGRWGGTLDASLNRVETTFTNGPFFAVRQ
jgi:hypothetical protein